MRDRDLDPGDDRLAGAARLHRRRHDPDRFRVRVYDLPEIEAARCPAAHRARGHARPTIGPTIGGYLTDLFSWHWLFLVNVLPGIVVTAVSWVLIDFDHPNFKLLRKFDWIGFLTMAGFLGALEYILEEGPTDNWFDNDHITMGVFFSAHAPSCSSGAC